MKVWSSVKARHTDEEPGQNVDFFLRAEVLLSFTPICMASHAGAEMLQTTLLTML